MNYLTILFLFATASISQPKATCEQATQDYKLAKMQLIRALNPAPENPSYTLTVADEMAIKKKMRGFENAFTFYCTACMVKDCELPDLKTLINELP